MGFANGGKNSNQRCANVGKGKGGSNLPQQLQSTNTVSASSTSPARKAFTQDPKQQNYTASTDESSDEESSDEEVLSEHPEFDNVEADWQSEIENETCKDLFSDDHFNSLTECLNSMKENHFGFTLEAIKKAFEQRYCNTSGSETENQKHIYSMYEHIRVINFFRLRGPHASKKLLEDFSFTDDNHNNTCIDYEKLLFSDEAKRMWTDDSFLCPAMASDPLLEHWSYFEDENEEQNCQPMVCNNVIMELIPDKNDGKIADIDPEILESIRREG